MWETVALEIIKNIVVPELASFIRKKFQEEGRFPTKEELEAKANLIAEDIKRVGNEFLNRPISPADKEVIKDGLT